MLRTNYSDDFEELWKVFIVANKKGLIGDGGKKAGYKAYQAKKCTPEDGQYLVKCLFNQINGKIRQQQSGEFCPKFQSPERWIRNERFEDSIGITIDAIPVRAKSDQRKADAAERYRLKHLDSSVDQAGSSEGDMGRVGQLDLRVLENKP